MNYYCVVETKLGFIALTAKDGKLTRSTLPKPTRELAIESLRAGFDESYVEDCVGFGDLPGKLRDYAEGKRVDFSDVPVDLTGLGKFYAAALRACQHVPYGEVVTYGNLARMVGSDRAARAIGGAMARNCMLIVIPCHRVVASGKHIGGFSAGLEWKRTLLHLEGVFIGGM
ncbi:MAG: methylated-DNA--[protein]-cysteine S-methyltransferase [Armatimonadota bacterium]|nr:methylated-DNA--[protein]-cysteine S-methyltransferase [bacterium]